MGKDTNIFYWFCVWRVDRKSYPANKKANIMKILFIQSFHGPIYASVFLFSLLLLIFFLYLYWKIVFFDFNTNPFNFSELPTCTNDVEGFLVRDWWFLWRNLTLFRTKSVELLRNLSGFYCRYLLFPATFSSSYVWFFIM